VRLWDIKLTIIDDIGSGISQLNDEVEEEDLLFEDWRTKAMIDNWDGFPPSKSKTKEDGEEEEEVEFWNE